MAIRNNVTRLLDARKIVYQVFALTAEKHSAMETARILGVAPEQIFKSIVVVRTPKGKSALAVIPAPLEVDLKAVAKALQTKKVILPTQAEAERLTKAQVGGISPLALYDKGFAILLDDFATVFEEIHISGGERGLNIRVGVPDLVKLTGAEIVSIAK